MTTSQPLTRGDIRRSIAAIAAPRTAVKGEKIPGCVLTLAQVMELEELVAKVAGEIARSPRSQQDRKRRAS